MICLPVTVELLSKLLHLPVWLSKILNVFIGGKPSRILVVPHLVKHMKDRGHPVVVLGMNDLEDVGFVRKVGATGALTDHCEVIKSSAEWGELVRIWERENVEAGVGVGVEDVGIVIDGEQKGLI